MRERATGQVENRGAAGEGVLASTGATQWPPTRVAAALRTGVVAGPDWAS